MKFKLRKINIVGYEKIWINSIYLRLKDIYLVLTEIIFFFFCEWISVWRDFHF